MHTQKLIWKKNTHPGNKFHLHTVEAMGKLKKIKKYNSFERCIGPVNDFFLHKCRNNRKWKHVKLLPLEFEKIQSPANEFALHRYGEKCSSMYISSTVCSLHSMQEKLISWLMSSPTYCRSNMYKVKGGKGRGGFGRK